MATKRKEPTLTPAQVLAAKWLNRLSEAGPEGLKRLMTREALNDLKTLCALVLADAEAKVPSDAA